MIHTAEIIHSVHPDDVRAIIERIGVDSVQRAYAYLKGRLLKPEYRHNDEGSYTDDCGSNYVPVDEYDTSTKRILVSGPVNGINSIKLMRICSKTMHRADKSLAQLYCSFYMMVDINPRSLMNPQDTYTIKLYEATPEHNALLEERFNEAMQSILCQHDDRLKYLCDFKLWNAHRVDYTVNMKMDNANEFALYWKLVHKTSRYIRTERKAIDKEKQLAQSAAEGNKSYKTLFYDKQAEVSSKYKDASDPYRSRLLAEAKNVIRLEQQCKSNALNRIKKAHFFPDRTISHFMSEDIAHEELRKRYDKMVGAGDFYHREEAKRIIRANVTSKALQGRLIQLLQLIASKRRLSEAQEEFVHGAAQAHGTIKTFRERLKKIRKLGIHPCLIPDACSIRHLRNPRYML